MKCCSKCKTNKLLSDFGKRSKSPDGLNSYCKQCIRLLNQESKARGIEKYGKTEYYRRKNSNHKKRNPISYMLNFVRGRCKEKNVEFNLTVDDIVVPSVCPVLNIPLELSTEYGKRRAENSASVDRIDSSKGYTPDNIIVISWRANRIKNDGTIDEHRKIVEFYTKLSECK